MAMVNGSKHGAVSVINVTPLIDVLLVLLIIFMVIVPVTPKGMDVLVPQASKQQVNDRVDPGTVVVQVLANGTSPVTYKINNTGFTKSAIEPKLAEIFAARNNKVMFVKGDPALNFSEVAEVIDFGHQAGVDNIGIITPQVEAGQ